MRKLITKFGTLYIEAPEDVRPDETRYVIEDSQHRWFDYFGFETVEDTWGGYEEFYKELQCKLNNFKTPEELLDYLGIDAFNVSKDWTDLLENAYGEGEYFWDEEAKTYYTETDNLERIDITKEVLLDNEYVNVIGDWYILVAD